MVRAMAWIVCPWLIPWITMLASCSGALGRDASLPSQTVGWAGDDFGGLVMVKGGE
jgi:hypothetical protein